MPTMRQLEVFLAVIDHGSIRSAADLLDISQPSVSKQIVALEKKVGAVLLNRHRGSKAIPTDAGNDLVALARQALSAQRGLLPQTAPRKFPSKIIVMMRQHLYTEITPWIEQQKLPGRPTEIQFEIVNDAIDPVTLPALFPDRIALVRTLDVQPQTGVVKRLLSRDKCSLYVSPDCASRHGGQDATVQGTLPVLVPSAGRLMQWQIDHLLLAGIAEHQFVSAPPLIGVLLRQTIEGRGASVFMDSHVSGHVERGELVPLIEGLAALYLQFLWHHSLDPVLADELCTAVAALRSDFAKNHW